MNFGEQFSRPVGATRPQRLLSSPVGALIVAVLMGVAVWAVVRSQPMHVAPSVPVPADLEKLDPQLREYIAAKLKWVREAPADPKRQATLGMVYAANGLWAAARAAFQNVSQLLPAEPHAQLYLAVAAQELNDLPEALNRFRDVAGRFPQFAPGFARLGDALLKAGAVDEAEKAFRHLTELAPNEWRGYAGLGEVAVRRNQFAEAARQLEHALQLAPSEKAAHHLLGLAYRSLGRLGDAQRELALGLDGVHYPMPDDWSRSAAQHMKLLPDLFEAADDYIQAGEPQKAVTMLEEVYHFHPNDLGVMTKLAIALNRGGEPAKGRALLLKVVAQDQRNLAAYVALAFSCTELKLLDEALAHAQRAAELAPNTPQPFVAKANALLALEKDEEALAALESASTADPKNSEVHREIGDICWRNLNRTNDALRHYEQAASLAPASAAIQVRLVDLYLELARAKEAATALNTLHKLVPNEPKLARFDERLKTLTNQSVAKP
ncbi:MAG: tetratricopeptide repeat protein [Verrucomicrobia bacterium]|nr:tetratricopeptide repeat protein [Verrucomicrobiota bacterium]